jgi:hypothetical protein
MKCSCWSSGLGVGCGASDPTSEMFTVMKPPETYGVGQDPQWDVGCVEEKNYKTLSGLQQH